VKKLLLCLCMFAALAMLIGCAGQAANSASTTNELPQAIYLKNVNCYDGNTMHYAPYGESTSRLVLYSDGRFALVADDYVSFVLSGVYTTENDKLFLGTDDVHIFRIEDDRLIFENGAWLENWIKQGTEFYLLNEIITLSEYDLSYVKEHALAHIPIVLLIDRSIIGTSVNVTSLYSLSVLFELENEIWVEVFYSRKNGDEPWVVIYSHVHDPQRWNRNVHDVRYPPTTYRPDDTEAILAFRTESSQELEVLTYSTFLDLLTANGFTFEAGHLYDVGDTPTGRKTIYIGDERIIVQCPTIAHPFGDGRPSIEITWWPEYLWSNENFFLIAVYSGEDSRIINFLNCVFGMTDTGMEKDLPNIRVIIEYPDAMTLQ